MGTDSNVLQMVFLLFSSQIHGSAGPHLQQIEMLERRFEYYHTF